MKDTCGIHAGYMRDLCGIHAGYMYLQRFEDTCRIRGGGILFVRSMNQASRTAMTCASSAQGIRTRRAMRRCTTTAMMSRQLQD